MNTNELSIDAAERACEEIIGSTNKRCVHCMDCNKLIFKEGKAVIYLALLDLPIYQKDPVLDGETMQEYPFWVIDSIDKFESINTTSFNDQIFLFCSGCKNGPIGIHKFDFGKYYIALHRVKYVSPITEDDNKEIEE